MVMDNGALTYQQESIVCKTCGHEFKANVVYIFGHRQGRGICPDCREVEQQAEREKEDIKRTAEIAGTRRQWRLNSGIPPYYQLKDFSTFDKKRSGNTEQIYKSCLEYADNFPVDYDPWLRKSGKPYHSLFLYSDDIWGNGKTYLVSAIAHRILDRWQGEEIACPVMFISEPEIYARIQETYSFTQEEKQKRPSEQQIINKMVGVRLLIIDDLGKQQRKEESMDFVRRTLFDIVNRRYNAMRPIVITSNKNDKTLRDYLGEDEAVLDRIIEMTAGNRIKVTAPSYRRMTTNTQGGQDE
jgi:DNA replication protein DnaC